MAGDQILVTSMPMQIAATNFRTHVLEFDTATKNLENLVLELAATWKGRGYGTFTTAMGFWNHNMGNVKVDLTNLSDAVQKSDVVFQSVDDDIANAFKPFAGY